MENQDANTATGETIALALSGGGSRAIAFHLGCLRALHKAGILQCIHTISSVSGGSVLGALYCHHEGDFASFEAKVREILKRGFVFRALHTAFTTLEGAKALICVLPLVIGRFAAFIVRLLLRIFAPALVTRIVWLRRPLFRRWASRTTILRSVFSQVFNRDPLSALRPDRPKLIMIACELQDKSAFYFAKDGVGSWRLGQADPTSVQIAQAVTASAAYPGLLPALDDEMTFAKDGATSKRRIILTDGGVYDNLGLSPLWPDRDPKISLHVGKYDRIVACRAGYGVQQGSPSVFWPSRMLAVLYTSLVRTENLSINRLFDLKRDGVLKGVLLPYLNQADHTLTKPPPDLVSQSDVAFYPTDFSAMSERWIERLSLRGEQLTAGLITEHWPEFQAN
jgi:NTE family protein